MNVRSFAQRIQYESSQNLLHIDLSHCSIEHPEQVDELRRAIDSLLGSLDHKVYAVVNYEGFELAPGVEAAYREMMRLNQEHYSLGTVRYSEDLYTRTVLRSSATRGRFSGNVCGSLREALERIEHLKAEHAAGPPKL